ncbi:MAG: lipocalin family protein [Bacilli bacterium]|nr:lipocalin family protein [Bacilli bacterium]
MKKVISFMSICFVMLLCLVGCGKDSEVVGKYNLTSISGAPGLSVTLYEYSYVELKSDGSYYLESKAKGDSTITSQKGTYEIDEELTKLTLITKNGSTEIKEIADYNKEKHSFTLITSLGDLKITMVLTKETSAS